MLAGRWCRRSTGVGASIGGKLWPRAPNSRGNWHIYGVPSGGHLRVSIRYITMLHNVEKWAYVTRLCYGEQSEKVSIIGHKRSIRESWGRGSRYILYTPLLHPIRSQTDVTHLRSAIRNTLWPTNRYGQTLFPKWGYSLVTERGYECM